MNAEYIQELFQFIQESPSCFHAISSIKKTLLEKGFQELSESHAWEVKPEGKYFVTRNQSSIIAFKIPKNPFHSFHITASHSDSPVFKIKENAELETKDKYIRLNSEPYGGMLCATWFDRPLSIAGRVMVSENGKVQSHLVNIDRDLVMIPNLAIHFNRAANDGYKYNMQKDMVPLFGDGSAKDGYLKTVAEVAGVDSSAILGTDLYLYNRMAGTTWGYQNEYISSPKLDDLECAFATLQGFLKGQSDSASVYCVFDNEEVGSSTKQGANSTFLYDVLHRLLLSLGRSEEDFYTTVASSFMLSADNAHAVHPNHGDISDTTNQPVMNGGIVIKYNANQKYTTDAVSSALFREICKSAGVPCQSFANRSDMAGGSTLGNISNSHVSLNTVDIGLAQLAMHSSYETAGAKDVGYLVKAVEAFYNSSIQAESDGSYHLTTQK